MLIWREIVSTNVPELHEVRARIDLDNAIAYEVGFAFRAATWNRGCDNPSERRQPRGRDKLMASREKAGWYMQQACVVQRLYRIPSFLKTVPSPFWSKAHCCTCKPHELSTGVTRSPSSGSKADREKCRRLKAPAFASSHCTWHFGATARDACKLLPLECSG